MALLFNHMLQKFEEKARRKIPTRVTKLLVCKQVNKMYTKTKQ